MKNNLPELKEIIRSKSSKEESLWKNALFLGIAAYLITKTVTDFMKDGYSPSLFTCAFMAAAAILVFRFRKIIYISDIGIVNDTHTWFSHIRDVLEWKDIKSALILHREGRITLMLEKTGDSMGWKAHFEEKQIHEIRKILKKNLEGKEVKEMSV